jgi:hypothetical protein
MHGHSNIKFVCACFTGIYERLNDPTTGVHRTKASQLKIVILLTEANACSQPLKITQYILKVHFTCDICVLFILWMNHIKKI